MRKREMAAEDQKEQAKKKAVEIIVQRFAALKAGDKIDVGGNAPAIIAKKNRFSVITDGGSKYTIRELYGIGHDQAKAVLSAMSEPAPVVAKDAPAPRVRVRDELVKAGWKEPVVDAALELVDAFAGKLVSDKKISSEEVIFDKLSAKKGGKAGADALAQAFDLFGQEVRTSIGGKQLGLGLDAQKAETPTGTAKPELVKALIPLVTKKGTSTKPKDVYMELKAKLKGEADALFANAQNPLPEMTDAVERALYGNRLFQGEKASISFNRGTGQAVIRALRGADASSLAHEIGHFLKRMSHVYYPDDIKELYGVVSVAKWSPARVRQFAHDQGMNTKEPIDKLRARVEEERVALAWERYLKTGQAPTRKL